MAIDLKNFALHLIHGYGQTSPAHLAHSFWSQENLRQHVVQTGKRATTANAAGQRRAAKLWQAHGDALGGALRVRKVAQKYLTGPLDLVIGTGRFRPQARPIYEAPEQALENLLHHPIDSGLVAVIPFTVIAVKIGLCAAVGCVLGAALGASRPRATLEKDAVAGAKIGANVGGVLVAAGYLGLLLWLTGLRVATAAIKASITSVSYGVLIVPALAHQLAGGSGATPASPRLAPA